MPMLSGATCRLISWSPMISTSPNGMTAKVTSAGNRWMHGRQRVQQAVDAGRG